MPDHQDVPQRIAFVINAYTGEELKGGNLDVSNVHINLMAPNLGKCTSKSPKPYHECKSRAEFQCFLNQVLEQWHPKNQLIFYFSGHGKFRHKLYCLMFGKSEKELYPFKELMIELKMAGVYHAILILDACYSGAAIGDIPKGTAILASSRDYETSEEKCDGSASVFTELFCEGIRTGLGGDKTSDGKISVNDIHNYILKKLETEDKYLDFKQRPVYSINEAGREIWIAENRSGSISEQTLGLINEGITSKEELGILYQQTAPNLHPCISFADADLDWELVKKYSDTQIPDLFQEVSNREEILSRLRLFSPIRYQGNNALHKPAVLCFCRHPHNYNVDLNMEASSIFYVGYPANTEKIIKNVHGPLSAQIKQLLNQVMDNLSTLAIAGKGASRVEISEIDEKVVREVLSNAIAHRDYNSSGSVQVCVTPEALEVRNPGRFPKDTSWAKFFKSLPASRPVNPAISQYLKRLLYFEGIGQGFSTFKKYIRENGQGSIICKMLPGPTICVRVIRAKKRKMVLERLTNEKIYKVFVSSTFLDNKERRKVVQEAITMAGMVWHGMEIFTAGTRSTVEECLRYAKEADVLVGIIAHRYGWEPEDDKSITEMEYDAANERLMFLIDQGLPVNKEKNFDPGPGKWKKQEKLAAFKDKIKADQTPDYFNEATLSEKVLAALNHWRQGREKQTGLTGKLQSAKSIAASDANLHDEIRSYCQKAESLYENLPVAGFVTRLSVPIDIEGIYVPLRAMIDLRGLHEGTFSDASHAEKCLESCDGGFEVPLTEAFRQSEKRKKRGLVLLGDPGSGKTTHLKRLLLWCLRNGPQKLGLAEGMLPVFLPLRELDKLDEGLDAFIQDQLGNPHLKTPAGFGERLLGRGNLLFLLDGLDEVANLAHREKVAGWIVEALQSNPTCRFVVTSRFAGYSPTVDLSEDFLEMHLRPLTTDQAERFIYNWYKIVERGLAKDPEQAEGIAREKADSLIKLLREPDFRMSRVFELARNPMLLANICLVHRQRGGLPHKRARLYEECVDVMLERWQEAKGLHVKEAAQDRRRALQPAALWLHSVEGRTRAKASELAPHIEPALKKVDWKGGSAEDFLRTIRDESGLLTGWDQEHYGFMHLGFQEYLAAREIRNEAYTRPDVLSELASHFGESWWQEVTLLLLALEEPSLFKPYMREVVKQPAFVTYAHFVDTCLDDASETSEQPFRALLEEDPGRDTLLWERQLVALRILERLNPDAVKKLKPELDQHPSPDIRRWIKGRAIQEAENIITSGQGCYKLVKIPGGIFQMGSPEVEEGRYDDEGPLHKVQISPFYMGKYPVTNQEYGGFLKENPDHREPEYWADRRFNQPRQPVVGVSWEDAKAYAAWVGLRLPTEAEWEYACRAGSRARYYKGDKEKDLDRAGWYEKNTIDNLHVVGEKEPNGFGLYDMHGNVWEWVEDDWHKNYIGATNDGSAWILKPRGPFRMFRGGSWYGGARGCRSAVRRSGSPGSRGYFLGFRLSRSVALSP